MQMVFTSKVRRRGKLPQQEHQQHQQHAPGRSRWLDCTNLWPLAVLGPAVFVFAAEWSSGAFSVLLVCTPFVFLTLFSLTLNQVSILVSLLASPVVSLIYGVINRGPGDSIVRSMLWSQAFIVLTAISLAWSVHGVITLREIIATDEAAIAGEQEGVDGDDHTDDSGRKTTSGPNGQTKAQRGRTRSLPASLPPEICIIKAAEAILSGHPGSVADEDAALAVLSTTATQARLHGLTMDAPVLQTANSLHAWNKVISHQGEVERDIRETDRWGVLEEKLVSMNAGMPFVVGIIQGTLLATSQLEESDAYGSGPIGTTFYFSIVAFAASIVVSTVLLVRMLTLINRAAHGLADAAKRTDTAMETFVDLRSWGILRHGEVGCLTHIAADRGMVRALEFLVQNGANPSSMDSTGKTPLEIARESGMTEACGYLEGVISGSHQSASSTPVRASPLADRLRRKAGQRRSRQTLPEKPGNDLAGGEGGGGGAGDSGTGSLTGGWRQLRRVAGGAVRWVGMSDKVLARRARGRIGVEPLGLSASPAGAASAASAAPLGHSPSKLAAEGSGSLLLLPPALTISCHKHDGGMLASGFPSASSLRPASRQTNLDQNGHDRHEPDANCVGSRPPSTTPRGAEQGPTAAGAGVAREGSSGAQRDGGARGAGETSEEGAGIAGQPSGTDASTRDDGNYECVGDGASASSKGGPDVEAKGVAERAPSPARPRSSLSRRLSATFAEPIRGAFSGDDGTAGTGGGGDGGNGGASWKLCRSEELLAAKVTEAFSRSASQTSRLVSTTLRRRLSSARAVSTLKAAGGVITTYSPTQAVLNITWALRRLRPLGTARERRIAFKGLRESSPVDIPHMFLLAFVDLAALGEIPRRTGDRFLGKADKRPVTVCDLMARAGESGEDPVVVYVSHRWLEPDFKNPDDHSKARFYQVCYAVQKLAKRMGRRPCEFYLWIDYACINQQNPTADRLALPYVLDACDFMVYVEDGEYWDQALSRTEHFLFHKLRRLRPPANGANAYEEDVFSLSADGERLTQRTYAETRTRFTHNPAKGSLTTETDRLYLWTLVLALEYEDTYTFMPNLPPQDETGFMKLLRQTMFVNGCVNPKEAAAEIATRDAQMHAADAAAANNDTVEGAGTATIQWGHGGVQGEIEGVEQKQEEGGGDPGIYGSGGCRWEAEVDGEGQSAVEGGHQESGGGGDGGVSRSGRGGAIRGGEGGSGDQAHRDDVDDDEDGDETGGGDDKSRVDSDVLGSSSAGDGVVSVRGAQAKDGTVPRVNSGGDSGDIETGAGGDVL
eukprot:g9618.t1